MTLFKDVERAFLYSVPTVYAPCWRHPKQVNVIESIMEWMDAIWLNDSKAQLPTCGLNNLSHDEALNHLSRALIT